MSGTKDNTPTDQRIEQQAIKAGRLFYFNNLERNEVAEVLGLSLSTTRKRLIQYDKMVNEKLSLLDFQKVDAQVKSQLDNLIGDTFTERERLKGLDRISANKTVSDILQKKIKYLQDTGMVEKSPVHLQVQSMQNEEEQFRAYLKEKGMLRDYAKWALEQQEEDLEGGDDEQE